VGIEFTLGYMSHEARRESASNVENMPATKTLGNESRLSSVQNPTLFGRIRRIGAKASLVAMGVTGIGMLAPHEKDTNQEALNQMKNRTPIEQVVGAVEDAASIDSVEADGGGTFADVPSTHPYYEAINYLANKDNPNTGDNIVNGYDDGTFRPNNEVVRQHFAKMIVNVLGLAVPEGNTVFKDVPETGPETRYSDDFIRVAAENGITKGITPDTFGPFNPITRAQVITMSVRAIKDNLVMPPADYKGTLGNFSDTHSENARIAEYNGLLIGLEGYYPKWDPFQKSTRGECAQILYNVATYEKQEKQGADLVSITQYTLQNAPEYLRATLPANTSNVVGVDAMHPINANQEIDFYLVHGLEGLSFSYENPEGSTIYKNKKLAVSMEINPSLFSTDLSFNYNEQVGIDFLLKFSIWGREGNETPAQYEQRVVFGRATELMQNHATNGIIRVNEIKDVLKEASSLSILDPKDPASRRIIYDRNLGQGPAIEKIVDSL